MISYKEALDEATKQLLQCNIMDAKLDAWYLLEFVSGLSRVDYMLQCNATMDPEHYHKYRELTEKRANHVPLQQLIGTQEFMGLTFKVNEHVLIPRQDTEILVEQVLKVCKGKTVLDMCTGSGCIIISIAALGDIKEAFAADLSVKALEVAKWNASCNNTNVHFIQSDMFEKIHQSYDIIVSNPPYIKTEEIEHLMPEVKDHEPYMALDGEEDGLKFYRIIANDAGHYLNEGGYLFLEIGYDQGEAVKLMLSEHGFHEIQVLKDFAGLDRVVVAVLNTKGYMEE